MLANIDLYLGSIPQIPTTLALAVVAVMGYLLGWRRKVQLAVADSSNARRELKRAQAVAKDLETIAATLRRNLAHHHASIARFKTRVSELGGSADEADWKELCNEVEEILGPTIQLGMHIARAYDEIRQQSHQLMTFTETRTDQLTGVSNRRALDDTLKNWVAMKQRYELHFSIVLFDIDHFKQINDEHGHLVGDQVLQKFARLMDDAARETDLVTRFGGEEFVILMPQTALHGACIFSERVRKLVETQLAITVSGGVAEATESESEERLLERADEALYHSKAAGRNLVSFHDGTGVHPVSVILGPSETPVEPLATVETP
ncbi:MAG TPA: GGDEF domain-containing protein [Pirellulales bacterium]|nr:GGDEF domain-containing protein [Pirellulales bacterium]